LKVIVIDPGHGGRDPGAVGPGGTKEADVNLAIAHLVKSRLERDFTVFMTRQNDETVTLNTRSAFANAKRQTYSSASTAMQQRTRWQMGQKHTT